jgi:drug/metabolite transporter (DMT)-like permease
MIDIATLGVIALMWGSSFIVFKLVVPSLGFATVVVSRLLIGGLFLWAMMRWRGERFASADVRHYTVVGVINSALPFCLFGVAAMHVPVAYSAVGNATASLWSALLGITIGERLSGRRWLGLLLGITGVSMVAIAGGAPVTTASMWGLLAGVTAAACYGIAGLYLRQRASHIPSFTIGAGSQLVGAMCALPLLWLFPPSGAVTAELGGYLLVQGLWCTGLPYALFFPLLRRIGTTRALTVTFLIPVVAIALAALRLGEAITPGALVGCLVVCSGTVLVLRKGPAQVAHLPNDAQAVTD